MSRRQALQAGTLVWVVAGAVAGLGSLGGVNADARWLVGAASIVGPLLGAVAALVLGRRADRSAGALLLLSALVTPTYFAYVLNIPALVVGGVLVVAPHLADAHRRPEHAT